MVKWRNGVPVLVGPIPQKPEPEPEPEPMMKAELVELASSLGVVLDGSETKADLITIIERQRRCREANLNICLNQKRAVKPGGV